MEIGHAVFLVAGTLAGGIVSGLTGFGTAITALGIWVYAIPPVDASSLSIVCSVVSQAQNLHLIWRHIDWKRVLYFVIPGLFPGDLSGLCADGNAPDRNGKGRQDG
jgi:uncharacterized protein